MTPPLRTPRLLLVGAVSILSLAACSKAKAPAGPGEALTISAKQMADGLHSVMMADRTVYTKVIVNRLQNEEKVITASEHFKEDKALALPAQMFRFGAEMVSNENAGFSYTLESLWAINKQNEPKTDVEKAGLQYVADHKGENYYGEEELGGQKYFTAVYADTAVAPACIACHNTHKDSPRTDFKMGDVMGGVVVRIPLGTT